MHLDLPCWEKVILFFPPLGLWSGGFFLIVPFPDRCMLVSFSWALLHFCDVVLYFPPPGVLVGISNLTHLSLASLLWDIGKQNSPRCDAAERGVPSGAILFAQRNFIEKLDKK